MKPSDIRSMCCRLRLDLRELRKKDGGFFGSGESTGSVGVLPSICRVSPICQEDKEDFTAPGPYDGYFRQDLFTSRREVIGRLLNEGLYPYTQRYLGKL